MDAMSEHLHAIPILPVHDLGEAVAFWSLLPTLSVQEYEGGGYAFVLRGEDEVLHLALFPDLQVSANRAGCYVHLVGIDQLHAACVEAGLPVSPLSDEPWGMREFRLTDPSSNVIRLGCAR